jgi:hypothetical protein
VTGTTPPRTPDAPVPDEAFARLRAADPARDLEPDVDELRRAVAARLDAPSPLASASSASAGTARRSAPGTAGPRRPSARVPARWFAIAAVTAGALVVGGAGFGLGSLTAGRGAGDVITLAQEGLPPVTERGEAADAASSTAIYPPWPGRTVFTASGLSDATGRSAAWALDAAAAFSAETAERAARALGLEGRATRQFGSWVVGSTDGRGPSLTLSPDGQASVSFYDPTKDPYMCGTAAAREDAAASGIRCADPGEGSAPRGSAAAGQMRQLLASMGIDRQVEIETTEYNVPETGGPRMTSVTAYLVLDGTRAGLTWSANLVANGTQSFYGPLAALVGLGDYDVVSENDAVRRLGDPRFGFTGGPIIALEDTAAQSGAGSGADAAREALVDPAETAPDRQVAPEPSDGPNPPTTPEPGSRIPWPVTEVTITKARLGLAQQTLPDGATVLVPAYELSDGDGRTWSVIAVADSALDFAELE